MSKENEVTRIRVVTNPVRASFVHIFKKREATDDSGNRTPDRDRYEMVLLIPPSTGDAVRIAEAINGAMVGKFGEAWKTVLSPLEMAKMPLKRCESNKWFKDQFSGWHYLNAWSKEKPNVVDSEFNDLIDPESIYPGCWVRVQLSFVGWQHDKGGKLCISSLDNVMFVKDGERIGGAKEDAKSAFSDAMEIKIPEEMGAASEEAAAPSSIDDLL